MSGKPILWYILRSDSFFEKDPAISLRIGQGKFIWILVTYLLKQLSNNNRFKYFQLDIHKNETPKKELSAVQYLGMDVKYQKYGTSILIQTFSNIVDTNVMWKKFLKEHIFTITCVCHLIGLWGKI